MTAKTITLGHLTDLTGPYGPVGKEYLAGANLFVETKNAAGGVCGRSLELLVRDDGYDVQKAATAYAEMGPKVLGMEAILGDGPTGALLPKLIRDRQLTSVLTWSSSQLKSDNLFLPGATYEIQVANGVSWAVKEFTLKPGDTIAVAGIGGGLGDSILRGTKLAADKAGLKVVTQWVKPTDTDFNGQITALKQANAKLVITVSTASQLGTMLSTASALGFDAKWLGGSPGLFSPSLLKGPAKDALEKDFWIASGQAMWNADTPAAKSVREIAQKKGLPVEQGFGVMTGYAQADAYTQILELACKNKEFTREGILTAFHSMKKVETGGLLVPLDFTRGYGKSQSLETFIVRPDSQVAGGLKRVTDNFTSPVVTESGL